MIEGLPWSPGGWGAEGLDQKRLYRNLTKELRGPTDNCARPSSEREKLKNAGSKWERKTGGVGGATTIGQTVLSSEE